MSSSGQSPRPRETRLTAAAVSTVRACPRRLWLQQHAHGEATPPSPHVRLLRERSRAHEAAVAKRWPDLVGPLWRNEGSFEEAAARTLQLLRETRLPLARAPLRSADDRRSAVPGFLVWRDEGLAVIEARLALRPAARGDFALQFAHVRALLREVAGIEPVQFEVVAGDGELVPVRPVSEAEYGSALALAEATLAEVTPPDLLMAHSFCKGCAFYGHCWDQAERERRIEILPEVQAAHVPHYHALGVRRIEQLAALDPESLPEGPVRAAARAAIRTAAAWRDDRPVWLARPELPRGPLVWFDVEGDSRGEEADTPIYLWGLAVDGDAEPRAEAIFADAGADGDRGAWERFVGRAQEILAANPHARFVHWDQSEPLWIRRYASRHGAPQGFEPRMLRACFDLKRQLDRCVRLPLRSYSIKHVAPWIGFRWRNPESGSEWSLVHLERLRTSADLAERQRLMAEIAEYNADDLWAMRAIWRWLEANAPQKA